MKTDLENLQLVHKAGLYYDFLKFPFPIKGVHPREYFDMFVDYVAKNNLYEYAYIDDNKLSKYLFVPQNKDGKSKFVMEVLGYSNDEKGWNDLRNEIIGGTDFSMMKFSDYTFDYLKVIAKSSVKKI